MVIQKLHGKMSVGTAEKVLSDMLNIKSIEVVIRHRKTKRDVRDDATISVLRRRNEGREHFS